MLPETVSLVATAGSPLTNLNATVGSLATSGLLTVYIIQNGGTIVSVQCTLGQTGAQTVTVSNGITAGQFLAAVFSQFGLLLGANYVLFVGGVAQSSNQVLNLTSSSVLILNLEHLLELQVPILLPCSWSALLFCCGCSCNCLQ